MPRGDGVKGSKGGGSKPGCGRYRTSLTREEWHPVKSDAFIEALAKFGTISKACEVSKLCRGTIYMWRKEHPEFKARFDAAIAAFGERLEDEAVRRAHDGWEEPVFYQGVVVGSIRKFDSNLMVKLLEANIPDKFRPKTDINLLLSKEIDEVAKKLGLDPFELRKEVEKVMESE